jgi:hypothetical protein
MDSTKSNGKVTRFLFYFFFAKVSLGMLAIIGNIVYSFIFG